MLLLVSEELAVIDNLSGKLYLVVYADPTKPRAWHDAQARLRELLGALRLPLSPPSETRDAETEVASNFDADTFPRRSRRAIRYVHDGDIMQGRAVPAVVTSVCRLLAVPVSGSALDQTRRRTCSTSISATSRSSAPRLKYWCVWSVYGYGAPDRRNAAAAGDAREDVSLERELLADPKERAEHVMLADLGPPMTLGAWAATGRSGLTETMTVERYSHVMHIVSNVEGRLRDGLDCLDVFRAAFPRGTVSGAPKVRAMEIIDELEPDKRASTRALRVIWDSTRYGSGHCIRTAVVKGGQMHVQAGAGIVAGLGARKRIAGNPCEGARRAACCGDRLEWNGQASMILMIDNYDSFT